ncbi:MAG: methionine gamma-lyase family protein [Bacilli bacterium]|nr:methionine gamma-lyase family protein [Mycoplasmatota bacterium]MDY4236604.1 methionine gamma-lyase family protein [Bacilli bacterium]
MINIDEKLLEISKKCEEEIKTELKKIDDICMFNSMKVLNAFHEENISEIHFNTSTGYGYNDIGRDKIEDVYKRIFKCEDALVRTQFISGSHALTVCLFGLLRPNDTLLSITGKPYDTLDEVIGITPNDSSLKSFGVNYEQIDLVDNNFDFKKIEERLNKDFVKVIEIQRSKGYSTRKSISIESVEEVIKLIKKVSPKTIVMIDNCYCEFVSYKEPTEVGADVAVGSLIKNLGGGITPNGAYIVGKKDLINLVAERLTVPGQGKEVGPSLGFNKQILQGLFLAPLVVANSLKTAIFTSKIMETLGYDVEPKYNEERVDIVQNIIFNNKDDLINYCKGIQKSSAIDSNSIPVPTPTPGYDDEVIMASGSFTQGSSIEFSCDGPIRPPYIAYQQGSLTYEYGKLGVLTAISELNNK